MKKYLFSLIIISLLIFPILVFAQQYTVPYLTGYSVIDVLDSLVDWLFTILVTTSIIFLVIAGFTFVTAQGDVEKVSKARRFVLYALIGLGVGASAWGLVNLVRTIIS